MTGTAPRADWHRTDSTCLQDRSRGGKGKARTFPHARTSSLQGMGGTSPCHFQDCTLPTHPEGTVQPEHCPLRVQNSQLGK
eukprot:2890919-Prymnesium_polylepis.1